jgi:hypothetical protein
MSYGKEVLEQDWSEFPVPDFNSLARLSEAPATKSENLGLFSGIVVYAARHVPVLKVEIDCLLVSMPANEFEQVDVVLSLVLKIAHFLIDSCKANPNLCTLIKRR